MWSSGIYKKRREKLFNSFNKGIIILPGNTQAPRNYVSNYYRFRQDSTFLYYLGIDLPGFMAILHIDENKTYLFGPERTVDNVIWSGIIPDVHELGFKTGADKTLIINTISTYINNALEKHYQIHILPPYRADTQLFLAELLKASLEDLHNYYSADLRNAIIQQRLIKSKEEIQDIENTLNQVTKPMHLKALEMAHQGITEQEIVGQMEGIISTHGCTMAFLPICSVHGETLHNESYTHTLTKDKLLLVDAGAESPMHYATDITRTWPIGRSFSQKQKEIYAIVLNAQLAALKAIKPNIQYNRVHLIAARTIVQGLMQLGLMKGNTDDAIENGAHALFFPHGIGHAMGLDVHDMENLGETAVGYDKETTRSTQFGLAYLRYGKKIDPGNVLTVEPGIYFIPALIEPWKRDKKFTDFINYDLVESYLDFGGIRIEDNILVTNTGYRILGSPIPKTIEEIEN